MGDSPHSGHQAQRSLSRPHLSRLISRETSLPEHGFLPRSGRGRCALPMTFMEALLSGPPPSEDDPLRRARGNLL